MRRCSGSTPWVTSAAWFKSLPAIIIHLLRSMARPLIVSLSIRPFSNSFLNLPTRSTPSQLYHPPVPEEVRSRGITAPAIPLERYKTVAFSKKNRNFCGQSFWSIISSGVASLLARTGSLLTLCRLLECRCCQPNVIVAQKGCFITKAADAPGDPATRPIAMRKCFLRVLPGALVNFQGRLQIHGRFCFLLQSRGRCCRCCSFVVGVAISWSTWFLLQNHGRLDFFLQNYGWHGSANGPTPSCQDLRTAVPVFVLALVLIKGPLTAIRSALHRESIYRGLNSHIRVSKTGIGN